MLIFFTQISLYHLFRSLGFPEPSETDAEREGKNNSLLMSGAALFRLKMKKD